jgi:hypothetical protein
MRLHSKLIAAALAVVMAVGTMSAPASAQQSQQQQRQGVGIFPLIAGPVGLAALVGPSTTVLTKNFAFWKWQYGGWYKVAKLHHAGWDIDITKKFYGKKIKVHAEKKTTSKSAMGKAVVGCIFGSALATIWSAARKGSAMGNPLRWRSQADHEKILASGYEKQFELTLDEANTAMAFCGLGSFALNWQPRP